MADYIAYVCRDVGGNDEYYEIKTHLLNLPEDISEEELEKLTREKFKRLGVELKEHESFEWELF
jgi:hypothetical protein